MRHLRAWKVCLCCALLAAIAPAVRAQGSSTPSPQVESVGLRPVVAGLISYQTNVSPGSIDVNPEFDPIILLPIGNKLLVESEFSMSIDAMRDHGVWGPAVVDHGVEYLQANYFLSPNITVVAGRFLTPFGIYRERLHPLWVRNLQAEPIQFSLNATSSNGGMLRGSSHLSSSLDLIYAGYFSAADTNSRLQSDKQAGFRTSLFLPDRRVEVGFSYNDTMSGMKHNMVGGDFTWTAKAVPLDVRAEAMFSKEAGRTYWVEAAYRLNKLSRNPIVRRTQLVFRQEQYWTPSLPINMSIASAMPMGGMGNLPDIDTKRSTVGMNYALTSDIRLNAAYGGNYATGENSHTWNTGLVYHFAVQ